MKEETKLKYLVAQVTNDEHKEIKKRAAHAGVSIKEWLCEAITLRMAHDDEWGEYPDPKILREK